jgi:DNA primase
VISSEVVEEVRRRIDAVEIIGAKVELRKSGTSYVGSCPFHTEKKGSFRVYPDGKRFMCFGCGGRGDVFEFLTRLEGKTFPAVVRELAAKVGVIVPLVEESPEERRARGERATLYAACAAAATHWQRHLWSDAGEAARRYLAARGVSEEVARTYRLGYALPKWHDLERALGARIPVTALQGAGVVATREDAGRAPHFFDRFRDRIIFPIEDARGRIVGFGGRAIAAETEPKYLNGPETRLYRKGAALYGLSRARETIRRTRRAILVEGYFDVLVLHQAGFLETVGCGGTTLTSEQVELLSANGCRELVLLFDGDEAGARAPAVAARVLLQAELKTLVAWLPTTGCGRSDPDTFVLRAGKASLEEVLAAARPLSEHLIDDAIRRYAEGVGPSAPVEHKLRALEELTPIMLATPEGLARSTFERAVARRLDIDIGPLRAAVHRAASVAEAGGRP